jgi:pimeloyl-ACP methyl ester carboxylesterase
MSSSSPPSPPLLLHTNRKFPGGGGDLAPGEPALVLIHGLDSASDTFHEVLGAMGDVVPTISMDLRGHGHSPFGPMDEPDFSLVGALSRRRRLWEHDGGGRRGLLAV